MSATTRWSLFETSAVGDPGVGGTEGLGTRAYVPAEGASGTDTFNIGSGNNKLYVTIDGTVGDITLVSGTGLDPRFLAKDISEKLHNLSKAIDGYDYAQCAWENGRFVLYSGSLGSSSTVTVTSGTDTAHIELGWGVNAPVPGDSTDNTYLNGGVTISGTYNGLFDETYKIVVNKENPIQQIPTKGGSNSYTGTITTGGAFNRVKSVPADPGADLVYVLSIDIANGPTMGGGTGNVPTLSWTSTDDLDNGGPVELLYPDYWYNVGTRGLMVKFTDSVFNSCSPAWTITCNWVRYVQGTAPSAAAGTAMYYYGSNRGDDATTAITCLDDDFTQLGSRGLYIKFIGDPLSHFAAGDEFYIICKPPQPASCGITGINYGNVTVSTESSVRCVMFEIMSGAIEISTVKFGLQNHGSFSHHDAGDNDTKFRFGTVGPGNNPLTPIGAEWRANVTASDISSDNPPSCLYATKEDLGVVDNADDSENIGSSSFAGMCADPIWLNIKLGASEVSANSTINLRCFFDYS